MRLFVVFAIALLVLLLILLSAQHPTHRNNRVAEGPLKSPPIKSRGDAVEEIVVEDPLPAGAVARLGTLRMRIFSGNPGWPVVSPDGRLVAAADDSAIRIWETRTGKELRVLSVPGKCRPFFSPDSKTMVARYEEDREKGLYGLSCWDIESGRKTHRFRELEWPEFSFTKGSKELVAFTGPKGTVRRWDLGAKQHGDMWDPLADVRKKTKPRENTDWNCVFSRDGKLAAVRWIWLNEKFGPLRSMLSVLDLSNRTEVWRSKERKEVWGRFDGPKEVFTDDGDLLEYIFKSGAIQIRRARTQELLCRIQYPWKANETVPPRVSIDLCPDGKKLVLTQYGGHDPENTVTVWEIPSGKALFAVPIGSHNSSEVFGATASFSPDGRQLVITVNGHIHLHDAKTGRETLRLPGHRGSVRHLHFSSDGNTLVSGIDNEDDPAFRRSYPLEAIFWKTATWKEERRSAVPLDRTERAFSPLHDFSIVGSDRTKLQLCTFAGKKIRDLEPDKPEISHGDCISSDVKMAVVHNCVYDLSSGKILGHLPLRMAGIRVGPRAEKGVYRPGWPVCFATGKRMVAWNPWRDTGIGIFEAGKGTYYLDEPRAGDVIAFSSNAHLLGETRRMWDVQARKIFWEFGYEVTHLAFSADDKYLAVGTRDGAVYVKEVATKRVLHKFVGHTRAVRVVAWSPDSRFVASGSDDTTVLVWDVKAVLR